MKFYTKSKCHRELFVFISLICLSVGAFADCGNVFSVKYGPYDYTSPSDQGMLGTVERRHFTQKVEMLQSGESTSEVMGDLHYTLNKFPNHYRALMALVKYDAKLGGRLPKTGAPFDQTVDCYFKRAFQFKPQSARLHQIYGIYFFSRKEYQKAITSFSNAIKIQPSAELSYNIGLSYFNMGDLNNAKIHAEDAYEGNYPLAGLKSMLYSKGIELKIDN